MVTRAGTVYASPFRASLELDGLRPLRRWVPPWRSPAEVAERMVGSVRLDMTLWRRAGRRTWCATVVEPEEPVDLADVVRRATRRCLSAGVRLDRGDAPDLPPARFWPPDRASLAAWDRAIRDWTADR